MTNSCFVLAYRKRLSLDRCLALYAFAAILIFTRSLHTFAQSPQELRVAAAADLQPVMPSLAAAYEHVTGVKLRISFGSSATLTQQLLNGDPQDIFLSADLVHPEQLISAGIATGLAGSNVPTLYANGVLVLWARKDSPAQPITLASLARPEVRKIAVANDRHAPYGLAATEALTSLHLKDKVSSKLVVAENIAQTAQFAESGNAQLALISLTIANSPRFRELGTFVRFPSGSYAAIRQCAVILRQSNNQAAAQAFLVWLTNSSIQRDLPKFGLDPAK